MPEAPGRGRTVRTRTIHPPGRPDVYMHVDVKSKKGPRGGRTVAGPVRHKKKGGGSAHGDWAGHHSPAKPL
jgi:hypothetical protein